MTEVIENKTFDEIQIGDKASLTRALRRDDVETLAAITGNLNLLALDQVAPDENLIVQGGGQAMWAVILFSTIAGTQLPGLGSMTKSIEIHFQRSVNAGLRVTATATVVEKHRDSGTIVLKCDCTDPEGHEVAVGSAYVLAPPSKIRKMVGDLPHVQLRRADRYLNLIQMCAELPPMRAAVVHPCNADSLAGALQAAERGLIEPILIGPASKIRAVAEEQRIDISQLPLVSVEHSHHAAEKAVDLVNSGQADTLMKGSLHTDELLHEVLRKNGGLRTERRISHCFLLSVPTYSRPIIVTDAAINIHPSVEIKSHICQNAIDLAKAVGIETPRVAILSAVETVTPSIPSTLDAAALCKMAERGQITGGILDGPLAFDNAVDEEAAATKGIVSPVAGKADILVVPDLEAGNMLAKQLTYMADAEAAGIVVGARAPIILTSRADSVRARLASCAVAVLLAAAQRKGAAMLKAAAE